jgi:hypothetical protein
LERALGRRPDFWQPRPPLRPKRAAKTAAQGSAPAVAARNPKGLFQGEIGEQEEKRRTDLKAQRAVIILFLDVDYGYNHHAPGEFSTGANWGKFNRQ